MKIRGYVMMAIAALGLSACANTDIATRNAPMTAPVITAKVAAYNVQQVRVTVPETLKVSEANLFYPVGDIVWRGDAFGNRYEQVKSIFDDGFGRAAAQLKQGQEVIVDITVKRFHSLSEKARFTIGGTHSIRFDMTVRDAKTGAVVLPTREISSDLVAYGGNRAMEAERKGLTQRVRVTKHLTNVLLQELSTPISGPVADAAVARRLNSI